MEIAARSGAAPAGDRLGRWLIMIGILATAFNDLLPVLPVGELASDAFIYMFPVLMLYCLVRPGQIAVPNSLALLTLLLAIALIAGVVANYPEISTAWFKGRSGMGRVVTQGMAVAFGLLVTLMFYNFTLWGLAPAIARGARLAILVMATVGLFEIGGWYGIGPLTAVHDLLSHVIHAGSGPYTNRLRTTAFEVSWAGVMMTFLFPFALSDLSPRSWKFPGIVALVFGMVFLAQSRTALLVIGSQGLLLAVLFLRRRADHVLFLMLFATLAAALLLVAPGARETIGEKLGNLVEYGSLDNPGDSLPDENVSNVTRLAAVRAGIAMFKDHPAFGVGFGQFGFNYPAYLSAEDFRSYEVRTYVTDAEELWPPTYSIHVRMLAETGILGYLAWLAIIAPPLLRSLRNADVDTANGRLHLAVAMTLAGWLLLGASIDSFRFFGGWIAVGVGFGLPTRRA